MANHRTLFAAEQPLMTPITAKPMVTLWMRKNIMNHSVTCQRAAARATRPGGFRGMWGFPNPGFLFAVSP